MTPLTNRDKKLLWFLAIVIILFVFLRFLIMPQLEQYFELDDSISLAELDQYDMELKMVSLPGTQKRNEELQERLNEAASLYYPVMSSQEIDREVTGFLLEYGLEIENLTITMPLAPSELEPYAGSGMAAAQQEQEKELSTGQNTDQETGQTADESAADQGSDQAAAVTQNQIYAADVVVKCAGTDDQMTELIDFLVNDRPSVAVTGYSYENPAISGDTQNSPEKTQKIMTIGLQLFMYDKEAAGLE